MTDCILKTEYDFQPVDAKNTGDDMSETRIPDHAIERFAKFLSPRFLADMEQRKNATD